MTWVYGKVGSGVKHVLFRSLIRHRLFHFLCTSGGWVIPDVMTQPLRHECIYIHLWKQTRTIYICWKTNPQDH